MRFYKMTNSPRQSKDDLTMSVTVIAYESPDYFDLAFYNYSSEQWHVLGDDSMQLKYWTYAPNAKAFHEKNKDIEFTKHAGYC